MVILVQRDRLSRKSEVGERERERERVLSKRMLAAGLAECQLLDVRKWRFQPGNESSARRVATLANLMRVHTPPLCVDVPT